MNNLKYYDFVFAFRNQNEDQFRFENIKLAAPDPQSAIVFWQLLSHGSNIKTFKFIISIVTTYYHQVKEYEIVKMDPENQFQFVLIKIYDREELSKMF